MSAGFSRLQLAAALLEYDNDPDNPYAPKRSAQDSAIFANFRRYLPSGAHRKGDYLGVPLSGEDSVSTRQTHSVIQHRHSKASVASINTLQNPFRPDDQITEEDESGEVLEVDLASWGLDAFMPKDKQKAPKRPKGKSKSTELLSVPTHQPLRNHDTMVESPRRALGASRSMSVGGNLEFFGPEAPETLPSLSNRRRSVDALMMRTTDMDMPPQRRRASSYTPLSSTSGPTSPVIPFPTTSTQPISRTRDTGVPFPSGPSQLEATTVRDRVLSHTGSVDSRHFLRDAQSNVDNRQRVLSDASQHTIQPADDNPFALEAPSHTSRFDPKARRTMSNATMGSRPPLEEDAMSTAQFPPPKDPRYSTTLDLLRPKVLVMPSPLQHVSAPAPSPDNVRDGFQLSTDGPPLPPGARTARRGSVSMTAMEPPAIASNSFTPNPLASLSLSQKIFRNTLVLGAETEGHDIGNLPRATEDGQQIQLYEEEQIEPPPPIPLMPDTADSSKGRPPGKLYGKSLIDALEDRKAKMRSKQRVFYGDERPSMMARGAPQRASTLIDPATLQARPPSQHLSSFGNESAQDPLKRRNSANIKPLLNFDDDKKPPGSNIRLPATRSVFGVDTLWEREMVKLREIEAQEKLEEEERLRREEAEAGKKKKKKKGKGKKRGSPGPEVSEFLAASGAIQPRVSVEPPVLPDIERAPRRAPPPVVDDDSESEGSADGEVSGGKRGLDPNWHAISSDEDEPRRTGPRHPKGNRTGRGVAGEASDDEDVPLSLAAQAAARRLRVGGDDSDDERPLSSLLLKQPSSSLLPDLDFDKIGASKSADDDDDDEQPLGLRASRFLGSQLGGSHKGNDEDEDDRPLALHPEQQRRQTQYQMLMQQQQHQQMMLQAQMQSSVYNLANPMMGAPFFAPPMAPMMMMQAPMPIPSPPPMHDEAKFGRVDRWRRDVAIEDDA